MVRANAKGSLQGLDTEIREATYRLISHEMSRIGKPIVMESRLIVTRGWGMREWRVTANGLLWEC